MYRSIFYFALFMLTSCLLGLIMGGDKTSLIFLMPNGLVAVLGLLVGAVLMHFSVFERLRAGRARALFVAVGVLLLGAGLTGTFSPDYFGLIHTGYMRLANILLMYVGGVGSLIAALEEDRESFASELLEWSSDQIKNSKRQWLKAATKYLFSRANHS